MPNLAVQSASPTRYVRVFAIAVVTLLALALFYLQHADRLMSPTTIGTLEHNGQFAKVTLVIASRKDDDTAWLDTAFLEWKKQIHVMDD